MEVENPKTTTTDAAESDRLPSVTTIILKSIEDTKDIFSFHNPVLEELNSQKIRLASKIHDEYRDVQELPKEILNQISRPSAPNPLANQNKNDVSVLPPHPFPSEPGVPLSKETAANVNISDSSIQKAIEQLPMSKDQKDAQKVPSTALALIKPVETNQLTSLRRPVEAIKPKWHPPWKLMRVISGHTGWVRSVAVDPSNEWFCTGAADKMIKIWDLASGTLKLTLTGHIGTIRGLAVSERHPYLFSAGDDKMVKCWDLEVNKVVRHYHGHLSGVYGIAIHPILDIVATCGRDSTVRVWDIRSKQEIFTLSGHTNTVSCVAAQGPDPQIISGSMDSTIRLWDLAAGKTRVTLTNHKKSVRTLAIHPREFMMASGSSDNIKQWKFPDGDFVQNLNNGHNAIINSLSVNSDGVLFSGADNGSMKFWDWKSGHCFQDISTTVQPGSLDGEAGIFASTFDKSGSRLITCEADKSIKIWKEDDNATEETHPLEWKPALKKNKF